MRRYDHVRPRTLDTYLNFLGISEREFYDWIEPMRDPDIWEKNPRGEWVARDSVVNHVHDPGVEAARVPQSPDRTFAPWNRHLYYFEEEEAPAAPAPAPPREAQNDPLDFIVL